jgi:hypothetical protein
MVTNNDYTGSCIQPTNQRRRLKIKRSGKIFRGKSDCSANGCGQVLKLQPILTNQFASLLEGLAKEQQWSPESQKRVATSMDELEETEFTTTPETESFCFVAVLSRQHNNSDTEVETQKTTD